MSNQPNFIGMGSGRAGTTFLYEYLKKHPQVYVPPEKELNFFSDSSNITPQSFEQYCKKFVCNPGVCGEISPSYMYPEARAAQITVEQVCDSMRQYLDPKTKLFFILRSPIKRALSQYRFDLKEGANPVNFYESLSLGANSEDAFIRASFVSKHLKKIFEVLNELPKLVLVNEEDLVEQRSESSNTSTQPGIKALSDFLGIEYRPIDLSFKINSTAGVTYEIAEENKILINLLGNDCPPEKRGGDHTIEVPQRHVFVKTGWYKWNKLLGPFDSAAIRGFKEARMLMKQGVTDDEAKDLNRRYFADEISALEDLIERDLGCWL